MAINARSEKSSGTLCRSHTVALILADDRRGKAAAKPQRSRNHMTRHSGKRALGGPIRLDCQLKRFDGMMEQFAAGAQKHDHRLRWALGPGA